MAERIDMSLDDIIKRDRIRSGGPRRGGGRPATGGARGGRGNVRKIGAVSRQMKSGAVRRNVGGQGVKPASRNPAGQWNHDKFQEAKSGSLTISNLHFNVSDKDLKELFGSFGPLKKASVHYDSSGRSLGKADVIFTRAIDATRAIKKYNGVPLDGRPMLIEVAIPQGIKTSIVSRIGKAPAAAFKNQAARPARGNARRGGGAAAAGGQRGRIAGGGAGGRPGQRAGTRSRVPKKVPTQAELDADLDAFNNKMV